MRKWISFTVDRPGDLEQGLTRLASEYDEALVLTDRYIESSGMYRSLSRFKLLAGLGAVEIIHGSLSRLENLIHQDDWYLGYIAYTAGAELFELPESEKSATIDFPIQMFFRPKYLIKQEAGQISLGYLTHLDDDSSAGQFIERIKFTVSSPAIPTHQPVKVKDTVSKAGYCDTVKAIQKHIQRGDIYEINYCIEFVAERVTKSPDQLFSRLLDLSPMPFSAFLKSGEQYVLCASPERYLRKSGCRLVSMPMKGTALRTNVPDGAGLSALTGSDKERAENIMITDLVRNDLGRVARPGTVKVEELCGVYPFPGIFQMVSTIACETRENLNWAEPIRCSFPMGSMTGAPKQRAMELIDVFEAGSRGIYSGAIGYITPERDFDFNVVIRSLFLNTTHQKASFWVGSAITAQAKAEEEYQECLLKASALMKILNVT